jgi:hypothetical protein
MRSSIRGFALAFGCTFTVLHAAPSESESESNTIAVVSTLHQFHESVPGYGFDALRQIIETLRPDILAVELTAKALSERTDQAVKREYQAAVFPFLLQHRIQAVPLEPDEPRYSQLGALMRGAQTDLKETQPQMYAAFKLYVDELYAYLLGRWTSPCAVNSPETDALFAVKHRYQGALFGRNEQDGWEGWNQHALDQILKTVQSNRGKRIVVLIGAEHAYWFRSRLSQVSGLRLLPNCSFVPPAR